MRSFLRRALRFDQPDAGLRRDLRQGDGVGFDHRHHLVEELALRGLARECSGQEQ